MTSKFTFAFAAAALALGGAAAAQETPRVYDYGPIIEVTDVLIEPGQLRDYMAYLSGPWRRAFEDSKRRGEVLDYRVYQPIDGKRDEGSLQLVIVYRDAAAIWDTPLDEQDRRTAETRSHALPTDAALAAKVKSRKILATRLWRELKFRDPPPQR